MEKMMLKIVDFMKKVWGACGRKLVMSSHTGRGWVYFVLMLLLAALACNLPGRTPAVDTSPTSPPTATFEAPAATEITGEIDTEIPVETAPEEPPAQPPPEGVPSLEPNLATGKTVYASNEQTEFPAVFAVDGDLNTMWNSGGQTPQWIEIDLGGGTVITKIRLHVSQNPGGNTEHELSVSQGGSGYKVVHVFSGPTDDGLTLEFTPDNPLVGYRILRVRTLSSPSWVAWKEIEVLGTFE